MPSIGSPGHALPSAISPTQGPIVVVVVEIELVVDVGTELVVVVGWEVVVVGIELVVVG